MQQTTQERIRGVLVTLRIDKGGNPIVPVVFAGTVRREHRMEGKIRRVRQGSDYRALGQKLNVQIEIPPSVTRKLW